MGLNIDPSNMEDRNFRALRCDPERVRKGSEFFRALKSGNVIAGVKDPALADWIEDCYPLVTDPVIVWCLVTYTRLHNEKNARATTSL